MAASYAGAVPEVDLHAIIDEFHQIVKRDRNNGRHQDQIDFGRLSRKPHDLTKIELKVKNVEWQGKVTTLEKKCHEKYANETEDDNVHAHAESEEDITNVNTVTITKGLMKDIGESLEIPLPEKEELKELKASLGGNLEIDVSKVVNTLDTPLKIRGNLGQDSIPKGDKRDAEIVSRCQRYKGKFTAEIHLSGTFLLQGDSAEHKIRDVISRVDQEDPGNGVLKNVIIGEGTNDIFWVIEGHCDLRWGFKHDFTWKNVDNKNQETEK